MYEVEGDALLRLKVEKVGIFWSIVTIGALRTCFAVTVNAPRVNEVGLLG